MSRICQLTGKAVMVGNSVSFSNRKTLRRFYPNLMKKKFFVEGENKWITLKISAAGLRTVTKLGINEAIRKAKLKGVYTGE
jgi:large subunit ribosomal protein L28